MKRFGYFANLRRDNDYVGLKTRTMNENPTTGMRTMSRKNLQNYVLPTPWYMVSFLFRFYSGSSYLKLIPPRPASIVESFLMFDEELAPQDPVNEALSYGQPIFQQQQQVSNAYEIRTPYYRAVRCDVVNTTQTPVYGDVRTCIRVRNTGSTPDVSNLFEAAGDDFNFFFLIGPPPMMDIRNVQKPSTFPTGTQISVNATGATDVSQQNSITEALPMVFTPDIEGGEFSISSSSKATIAVKFTDGTSEVVPLIDCFIYKSSTKSSLRIPINEQKDVDLTATLTNVKALGTFSIITDAIPA
jgi:hypothetical protein